jgi:hypothetical protein
MELDLDAFYARMYKETVTGDWEEFADEAVKLKWVGKIDSFVTTPSFGRRLF